MRLLVVWSYALRDGPCYDERRQQRPRLKPSWNAELLEPVYRRFPLESRELLARHWERRRREELLIVRTASTLMLIPQMGRSGHEECHDRDDRESDHDRDLTSRSALSEPRRIEGRHECDGAADDGVQTFVQWRAERGWCRRGGERQPRRHHKRQTGASESPGMTAPFRNAEREEPFTQVVTGMGAAACVCV